MAQIIADVMTRDPATIERRECTGAAARRMAAAEATPNLEQGPRPTSTH
jgi:hypothetical protein